MISRRKSCSFRLSSEGEELALFEKEGNYWHLRDYVSFGSIQERYILWKDFDGASQWQFFEILPNFSNNILKILSILIFLKLWPNPTESENLF